MTRTVHLDLGERRYDVHIGRALNPQLAGLAGDLDPSQVVVISDSNVAPLYADGVLDALRSAGLDAWSTHFPAGETSKTLTTASQLIDTLLTHRPAIDRKTLIVALGGGVVGDLAGFVAAVTLRGLRVLQAPTTLLADVDSSVGGKTGVDHEAGKNLIGAFHQPAGVVIDVDALRTLPRRELSNGLAECVKHAVIRDATLLDAIDAQADDLLAGRDGQLAFTAEVMGDLLAHNVAIKADIVIADEREAGVRAHLNFGHTIGHAIETLAGYEHLRHGEAVALGMVAENALAVNRGRLTPPAADRVRDILQRLALPVTRADLNPAEIWRIMQHDKKNRDGRVRMVLPDELGEVQIIDDITAEEVTQALLTLQP